MTSIFEVTEDFQRLSTRILDNCLMREPNSYDEFLNNIDLDVFEQTWQDQSIENAHVNCIDARNNHNLFMMKLCIFPRFHNNSPIYEFNFVAGKDRISNIFHDFAPIADTEHPLLEEFQKNTQEFTLKNPKNLSEWAQKIYSNKAVYSTSVNDVIEAEKIFHAALYNLESYINSIEKYNHCEYQDIVKRSQDFFCNQKLENSDGVKQLEKLGLSKQESQKFFDDLLSRKRGQ